MRSIKNFGKLIKQIKKDFPMKALGFSLRAGLTRFGKLNKFERNYIARVGKLKWKREEE